MNRLLPLLTDQPQNGDALGAFLGVGRVTVNTLARKLIEEGVPLNITRAGYSLEPGTPAPALVSVQGEFGRQLRYFGTVQSTQDEIRAWADDAADPAPHGAVVVAERQLAGRGRRGRSWDTALGTLAFSVLLRGDGAHGPLTLGELSLMPLAAGVALHRASGVGGLKWPNDLLANDGRKIAGILLDADLRGEEALRAVLGIGINVTAAPQGAASVAEFQPDMTRAALLSRLLTELEHWLFAPAPEILSAWKAASLTLGQEVRVSTARGEIAGRALDLDSRGSLVVQQSGGLVTVTAGDVQLVNV